MFTEISFLVATNMPEEMTTTLFLKLEMIYLNALKIIDTVQEGQQNSFPLVHYSFWIKYGSRIGFFFFFFFF